MGSGFKAISFSLSCQCFTHLAERLKNYPRPFHWLSSCLVSKLTDSLAEEAIGGNKEAGAFFCNCL
jgi:hypothetical protein